MFNYFELLLVLLQIELRNTDFFNAISRHLKYRTTNMGSLPLFISQAVFKEDRGHGNENEGLLITSLVLYFSWKKISFWVSFFLHFSKRDINKTWKFECRFQRVMFKNMKSSSAIRQYWPKVPFVLFLDIKASR